MNRTKAENTKRSSFVPSGLLEFLGNNCTSIALISIFLAALALRLSFLAYRGGLSPDPLAWAGDNYFGGITEKYLAMRDRILSGGYEPQLYFYLPGYPAFLAFLKSIRIDDLNHVRIIQAAVDSFAVAPLFYVARRIAQSASFALVSCGIYAIAPWWAAGSTYLLAESLLPALVISLLATMAAIRERPEKSLHWVALGAFAAVLPYFRSEMVLLVIPLAAWALLVAPPRRRLLSTVLVITAFAALLLAWSTRNYAVHGHFMLTPPAKWYAAWSGLGQIPNDFGYFVNDSHAAHMLASKGISFDSMQSEEFWKREYISAWLAHPMHVFETIIFRFRLILTGTDMIAWPSAQSHGLIQYLYLGLMCITPAALFWLVWKRRWSDAMLVVLPVGYALCSLGILYVERRYVRYAGLTYVLAFPVFMAAAANLPSYFLKTSKSFNGVSFRSALGIIGMAALTICFLFEFSSLRPWVTLNAISQRSDRTAFEALPWAHHLDDTTFGKAIAEVETFRTSSGLMLRANARSGTYLLITQVGGNQGAVALIKYGVRLDSGALAIGVLSGDSRRWLTYQDLRGAPGSIQNGEIATGAESGSQLVITAGPGDGEMSALIKRLEWKLACPRVPIAPLLLLFNQETVPVGACRQE